MFVTVCNIVTMLPLTTTKLDDNHNGKDKDNNGDSDNGNESMTEMTAITTTTTVLFEDQGDKGSLRETRAGARDADVLRAPGMFFFFLSYFTCTKGHLQLNRGCTVMHNTINHGRRTLRETRGQELTTVSHVIAGIGYLCALTVVTSRRCSLLQTCDSIYMARSCG